MALIKAGAFDCFNTNRFALINEFNRIRKNKDEELDENSFTTNDIMTFEEETLGLPLTIKPWFSTIPMNDKVSFDCKLVKVQEKYDRNGGLMAFVKVETVEDKIPLELVVFASTYRKSANYFDMADHDIIHIFGTKTDKSKVSVYRVKEA